MKYHVNWLKDKTLGGERFKFLWFWGHRPSPTGGVTKSCFSQWWHEPFRVDGVEYLTAEHWMMAEKARLFNAEELRLKIISSTSPGEAKALGRMIEGFDETAWLKARYQIVLEGNLYKFGQYEKLKAFLLDTKDRVLVEASPVDPIWGIGMSADHPDAADPFKWNGLNLLGFALMEARDILSGRVG